MNVRSGQPWTWKHYPEDFLFILDAIYPSRNCKCLWVSDLKEGYYSTFDVEEACELVVDVGLIYEDDDFT